MKKKKVASAPDKRAAPKKSATSKKVTATPGLGSKVELVPLGDLDLDSKNPRFGAQAGRSTTQIAILDTIVRDFEISDVLSSISVNGFFPEEPLVGIREKNGRVRIVEGNRRLAACLIIANDPRAKNQGKRIEYANELCAQYKSQPPQRIPVVLASDDKRLWAYLGVRHIAASQPWDSYAKAVWIDGTLASGRIGAEDLIEMLGDQHRTVARSLEGYRVVKQAEELGAFSPAQSMRRGRGSNPDYPFSWVYTALGFKPFRDYLGMEPTASHSNAKPFDKKKAENAATFFRLLFGDSNSNAPPAIADSRKLPLLARAITMPAVRRRLEKGDSLESIEQLMKPGKERLEGYFEEARTQLTSALGLLTEGELEEGDVEGVVSLASSVHSLARSAHEKAKSYGANGEQR
jgi:hypothetical protein